MIYLQTTTTRPFGNQAYFNGFNWQNFAPGDIVWLEGYTGADYTSAAAVFIGRDDGAKVALKPLPDIVTRRASSTDAVNLNEMYKAWQAPELLAWPVMGEALHDV